MALFAVCAHGGAINTYNGFPLTTAYAAPYVHSTGPITQYSSVPAVTSYAAPLAYSAPVVSAPVAYTGYAHAAPVYAARSVVAAPVVYSAPTVYSAPAVIAKHAATYTAVNKGSVHTAPLEGHVVDQTSLNLASAPGTL